MNILPGFTAETSLCKKSDLYEMNTIESAWPGAIIPQLKIVATHRSNSRLQGICAGMGDLVNEAVQEGNNASNADERNAWLSLAREMHRRATSNTGCSFSVV